MDDRRKAIQVMHNGGMTFDEIGKVLGLSRQRVHQIVNQKPKGGKPFHTTAIEKIPYVGLREWLIENRCSISELSRRCGDKRLDLSGKHSVKVDIASRILQVTGLGFDECFRRDEQ